ncbi:hypothetical protein [Methanobrevibacter sp.]|uniref:hypothetical protein n=1 Tax=Methanobrevibacter sp. TaxID=66852 RepID=UPI003863D855
MKINRFLILSIFVLAVITIGAVSASDNITDEASLEEETAIGSPMDDAGMESQSDEDIDVFPAKDQKIRIEDSSDDAKGNFTLKIDGADKEFTKENDSLRFDASDLTLGGHIYEVNFSGDGICQPALKSGTLNVVAPDASKEIFVCSDMYLEHQVGDDIDTSNLPHFDYGVTVTEEYFAQGNFTRLDLEINGRTYDAYPIYYYDLSISRYFLTYFVPAKSLTCGNYLAKLHLGNGQYRIYNLTVVPYRLYIGENGEKWVYGKNDHIRFVYSKNLTGHIRISINSKEMYNKDADYGAGVWSEYADVSDIRLSDYLNWGVNEVSFEYCGGNYPNFTETFNADFSYTLGVENMTESLYMHPYYYFFNAPNRLSKDKLSVKIDGVEHKDVDYGAYNNLMDGFIDISQLDAGRHSVVVSYEGDDKFYPLTENAYIEITSKVALPDTVVNGDNKIIISNPSKKNAAYKIVAKSDYDAYDLSVRLVNGQAKISLAHLNGGTYFISLCDFGYSHRVIVKNNKLTAKGLTKYYGSTAGFKVKVTDYNGKPVKGKYVNFYINGNHVKKVKTTKNGYATLKIAKAPGTYKVSAKYGKVQITRKVTVKHVVTLKTATVKKSAKSLTLKATLKQGKKALKNKKVTFKFNGKTYKAKTNKYGIAKVTIKKAILKKLKAGKTVKYQVTYLKDTVRKSAKVKK